MIFNWNEYGGEIFIGRPTKPNPQTREQKIEHMRRYNAKQREKINARKAEKKIVNLKNEI